MTSRGTAVSFKGCPQLIISKLFPRTQVWDKISPRFCSEAAPLGLEVVPEGSDNLKLKAKKLGVKYQTFISEILHKIAHS